MSLRVVIDEGAGTVTVAFRGLSRLAALSKDVTLSASEIVAARVEPRREAAQTRGWRTAGGWWFQSLATGHFTMANGDPDRTSARRGPTDGQSERQLWLVYRDQEVLVIDTTRSRPAVMVLQTPDRVALATRINDLVKGR